MSGTVVQSGTSLERLAKQKARLQALRDQARQRYTSGAPGLQVAALISAMTARLIIELFEETLAQLDPAELQYIKQNTALIAVGGSGRGELAPYSDADILFLHRGAIKDRLGERIAQTVRDCWDSGIKLGHSVRTVGDAVGYACQEPQFATSLVEARLLWGDQKLCDSLSWRFYRKVVRGRLAAFYNDCLSAREEERNQFGSAVQQLEPDVKRSPGGLRDIHLIRWLGFARHRTTDLDLLRLEGALTREDAQTLAAAQEFLTRIRVELHFAAGKAQELLLRAEQLRLAELYGFTATAGQRPVERFMQAYFRHSTAIADVAARFVARHRPEPFLKRLWKRLLTHRSNGVFLVRPDEIDVVPNHRAAVCGNLEQLLNLYELAGLYSVHPAPALTEAIKLAVPQLAAQCAEKGDNKLPEKAAGLFLSIIGSGNASHTLRGMYATGLLELVIPPLAHARCLLQFNQYHAYTVDEHTLRAVEAATRFGDDPGPIGAAYREIHHKEILHLALLLHDLGKGFKENHSDVGRRIAEDVAARLRLSTHQTDLLVFLVHKHLAMPHLAFRRDLSDPEVLLRFSRDVGSPEYLRMLYVLSCADITAVGPGAWTGWKAELLTELYQRAMSILGGAQQQVREGERFEWLRQQVLECLTADSGGRSAGKEGNGLSEPQVEARLATFPPHYLASTPPEQIAADLHGVAQLAERPVIARGVYEPATNTVEYRVITRDEVGSGCFSKITGALTAKRLEILSANICTTSDGIVIDSFHVSDADHAGAIPDFRLHAVETAIGDVLSGRRTVESLFQRHKRFAPRAKPPLSAEPTRVVIDNDSSERFTIIDVFAHDKPGLLYTIASALLDLDLSVSLAKIGTHLDQVLDVFYVTSREGSKLAGDDRLQHIQKTLARRIEEFERQGLTPVPV